ncbi:MAG: replication factor C large subunit [Nitrososphaerota archaeon]
MSIPLTEKYRPRSVSEVIGNKEAVSSFLEWMKSWEAGKPIKKSAFLVGPPGVGKTSLVIAYAKEHGYDLIEVNASDRRGAEQIKAIIAEASKQSTLAGTRKRIILVDEVDGAYGSEATGGINTLASIIPRTNIPIVLVANDPWDPRLAVLRNMSLLIKFSHIRQNEIMSHLRKISEKEGVKVSDELLKFIASRSNGDLRSAINDLQLFLTADQRIVEQLKNVVSTRDRTKSVFEALAEIFGATNVISGRNVTMNLDVDLDTLFTWIIDNLPNQIKDPQALFESYEFLALADLHYSRANRLQRWDYIKYAIPLLGSGPGIVKSKTSDKGGRFEFPSKIRFMQETREKREKIKSILRKLAMKSKMSQRKAATEMMPFIRAILGSGKTDIAKYYELDNEEIAIASIGDNLLPHVMDENSLTKDKEKVESVKTSQRPRKRKT